MPSAAAVFSPYSCHVTIRVFVGFRRRTFSNFLLHDLNVKEVVA